MRNYNIMKRTILIITLILLSFLLVSCVVNKEYNDVTYQKNHDYYYMSNEDFMNNYYHYDLWPNYQFKLKKR